MGRLAGVLRREPVAGALLVLAAVAALVWANSPGRAAYLDLGRVVVGPGALDLALPLSTWASDGLLAVFFFVVGLELKQEFVAGSLRDPVRAAVPIAAAVGGMAAPAAIYLAVVGGGPGWAVPMATDIAFALAVLAVLGRSLPPAARTFLLTLAVVDDLIAITVIAVVYTAHLALGPLALAVLPLGAFAALVRWGPRGTRWLLVPLAVVTWWLVHASGVHATVAGVLLGLTVPVRRPALAAGLERRWRPLSAGLVLPVFAFFAAGIPVAGGVTATLTDPVALGVAAGLVAGKVVGILATVALLRVCGARLDPALRVAHLLAVSLLAGIGFTVSLLIAELAFPDEATREHARAGVLAASLVSALLAGVVLLVLRRLPERRRVRGAPTPAGTPGP